MTKKNICVLLEGLKSGVFLKGRFNMKCEICGKKAKTNRNWAPDENDVSWVWQRKEYIICDNHIEDTYKDIAEVIGDKQRDLVQASVFLEMWGSASDLPEHWKNWKYSFDFAPEWLNEMKDQECVSVLHNGYADLKIPKGYSLVFTGSVGEKECVWCGESYRTEDGPSQDDCQLCEGSGWLYWGEEWQLLVFKKD